MRTLTNFRVIVPSLITFGIVALRLSWGQDIKPLEFVWVVWVGSLITGGGCIGYAICFTRRKLKDESERQQKHTHSKPYA